jgi:hypothetical protein
VIAEPVWETLCLSSLWVVVAMQYWTVCGLLACERFSPGESAQRKERTPGRNLVAATEPGDFQSVLLL